MRKTSLHSKCICVKNFMNALFVAYFTEIIYQAPIAGRLAIYADKRSIQYIANNTGTYTFCMFQRIIITIMYKVLAHVFKTVSIIVHEG